jgi:hypothetical protein
MLLRCKSLLDKPTRFITVSVIFSQRRPANGNAPISTGPICSLRRRCFAIVWNPRTLAVRVRVQDTRFRVLDGPLAGAIWRQGTAHDGLLLFAHDFF